MLFDHSKYYTVNPRQHAESYVPNTYHCSLATNAGHIRGTALCVYMNNLAGLMPGRISAKKGILETAKLATRSRSSRLGICSTSFSCPTSRKDSNVLLQTRACIRMLSIVWIFHFADIGATIGRL